MTLRGLSLLLACLLWIGCGKYGPPVRVPAGEEPAAQDSDPTSAPGEADGEAEPESEEQQP